MLPCCSVKIRCYILVCWDVGEILLSVCRVRTSIILLPLRSAASVSASAAGKNDTSVRHAGIFYSRISRLSGFISAGVKPMLRWYYSATKAGDSVLSED